ncbi:MAG: bacteriorhodopsin [Chloroflexi bacterium]|nr:bacteriorhodopsin [Chloroflexota bacterium]
MTPLWLGTVGMTIGTIVILLLASRMPKGELHHVVPSAGVTAIAAVAYYAMTQEMFMVEVAGREDVFAARYMDWLFTTPLLLLGLLLVAMPNTESARDRGGIIGGVLGVDVFMIATGYLAAIAPNDTARYVFYTVSSVAFLAIVVTLWGVVRRAAVTSRTDAVYNKLLPLLTVLWFIYPILWLLGTEGFEVLSLTGEVWVFAIIDVSAKVLFGILLVTGVAKVPAAKL